MAITLSDLLNMKDVRSGAYGSNTISQPWNQKWQDYNNRSGIKVGDPNYQANALAQFNNNASKSTNPSRTMPSGTGGAVNTGADPYAGINAVPVGKYPTRTADGGGPPVSLANQGSAVQVGNYSFPALRDPRSWYQGNFAQSPTTGMTAYQSPTNIDPAVYAKFKAYRDARQTGGAHIPWDQLTQQMGVSAQNMMDMTHQWQAETDNADGVNHATGSSGEPGTLAGFNPTGKEPLTTGATDKSLQTGVRGVNPSYAPTANTNMLSNLLNRNPLRNQQAAARRASFQ